MKQSKQCYSSFEGYAGTNVNEWLYLGVQNYSLGRWTGSETASCNADMVVAAC
jgi:hypothetical protein